jgi:hypothetical protein
MKRKGVFAQTLVCVAVVLVPLCQGAFAQKAEVEDSASPSADSGVSLGTNSRSRLPDFNEDIYYRHKTEFSLENGYLPRNIPFVYNFVFGSSYARWPIDYTLVPTIASFRWQRANIGGPWLLRGNDDYSFSASFTAIPRGPETRYVAFDFGIRRNFVPRRSRVAPYFEMRGGVGNIDAKGPDGVIYAQGQDLTFTYMMGSGARYNFNPRYSIAAGATYMHISNAGLSEPKVVNYGINVWGPIFGFYTRLGKARQSSMAK